MRRGNPLGSVRVHVICVAAASFLAIGKAGWAQTPSGDVRVEVVAEWVLADMLNRTGLWMLAGETITRGLDMGIDAVFGRSEGRQRNDVAARLARVWLVNLPVAALTEGRVHDAGHFARAAELGLKSGTRRIHGGPGRSRLRDPSNSLCRAVHQNHGCQPRTVSAL